MKTWKFLAILCGVMGICGCAPKAHAAVLGGQLYGSGSPTTATILASDSSFENLIWKLGPLPGQFLGLDNTNVGTPQALGTFSECDELLIGIFSPKGLFVTGPGARNPDGLAHAALDWLDADSVVIGFEDLFGGGDNDFNDAIVRLDGVHQSIGSACGHGPGCTCACPTLAPEPGTLSLLGAGVLGLVGHCRRRRPA